ncbi:MAG: metalloprotease [Thermoplasmata archaeon]|nr:MAG: metalloprotease [Thermoplasmata archaeon]
MRVKAIERQCLEFIKQSARELYPNEFLALLSVGDNPEVITELVLLPQMVYGKRHATFDIYMAPYDRRIVGTVHSHPSGSARPSEGDLATFQKHGRVHIIIAYPYEDDTWRAYDQSGREVVLAVV